MIPFKVKIGFLPSVWSGPSLGAVSYSCSPAGEGPPPHIWPGGRGVGAELGTLRVEWANV